MAKKPPVTSARRRAERASSSNKVAASTPKPRQTSAKTQSGPLKPGTRTTSDTRNPNRVRAGLNQSNKPGAGRVTGTMGRPKPTTPARVTTSKPGGALAKITKALPPGKVGGALAKVPKGLTAAAERVAVPVAIGQSLNTLFNPKSEMNQRDAKILAAIKKKYLDKNAGKYGNRFNNPSQGGSTTKSQTLGGAKKAPMPKGASDALREKSYASLQKFQVPKPKATAKPATPKAAVATPTRSTTPTRAASRPSTKPAATRKASNKEYTEFSNMSPADIMKGYGMRINQTFSAESPSTPKKRQSLKDQTAEIKKMIEESKKRQGK